MATVPNTFSTQATGNVPALDLDEDFLAVAGVAGAISTGHLALFADGGTANNLQDGGPFAASGDSGTYANTTGTLVSGHIAEFDANGNIKDGGTPATGPFSTSFISTGNAFPSGGSTLSVPHLLSGEPFGVILKMNCTTANVGYTAGQDVMLTPNQGYSSETNGGFGCYVNSTSVVFILGAAGFLVIMNPTNGDLVTPTLSDWTLTIEAWR